MRTSTIRVGVIACLVCLAGLSVNASSRAETASGSSAADTTAIRAQVEKYRKAFEARDVDAIMANYAPGAQLFVFDAVPPREYASAGAYRKDWKALFALFPGPIKDRIGELNATVVGPVAYSHRIEDTVFTKKDGSHVRLVVRETDVYRKISGKWLVVQEHVSFPVDPVSGKADLLSKP